MAGCLVYLASVKIQRSVSPSLLTISAFSFSADSALFLSLAAWMNIRQARMICTVINRKNKAALLPDINPAVLFHAYLGIHPGKPLLRPLFAGTWYVSVLLLTVPKIVFTLKKSPLPPLCQRGAWFPPLANG